MRRRIFLGAIIGTVATLAGCSRLNSEDEHNQAADSDYEDDQPTTFGGVKSLGILGIWRDEQINGSVTIKDGEGNVLSETDISTNADGELEGQIPVADESGDYTAIVTIDDHGTVTAGFDLRTPVTNPVLWITDNSDEDEPFHVSIDEAPDV